MKRIHGTGWTPGEGRGAGACRGLATGVGAGAVTRRAARWGGPLAGLGARLLAARTAAGLTGPRVRELTGIDPGNLSRIERGQRLPTLPALEALARAYRVPLADLFPSRPAATSAGPEDDRLSPGLATAPFLATTARRFRKVNARDWQARADLRENARWFATRVFDPAQEIVGATLLVRGGYRTAALDRLLLRHEPRFSAHALGLAADVAPASGSVRAAFDVLCEALRAGRLPHLDVLALGGSRWIHLQAAPPSEAARQLVWPSPPCTAPASWRTA